MPDKVYTLVTGASEGFGKSLAIECARRGMNLLLVALPGEELAQLQQFIEKNYGVSALCFGHDLSKKEECYRLFNTISENDWKVNMLINNAGIGGTHRFIDKDADYYQRQIALNVLAPTILTYFFLPLLQEQPCSYILNVSSMAGLFAVPKKQVYGGTKSYLLAFSRSLRAELRDKNVKVTVICPGGMNTTLPLIIQNRGLTGIGRWSIMEPEEVAIIAIDGLLKGRELIIPGHWNRFIVLLNSVLPALIKNRLKRQWEKKVAETGGHPIELPVRDDWKKTG